MYFGSQDGRSHPWVRRFGGDCGVMQPSWSYRDRFNSLCECYKRQVSLYRKGATSGSLSLFYRHLECFQPSFICELINILHKDLSMSSIQLDMVSEVGKWIRAHRQPSKQPILILNGPISWLIRATHPAILPAEMASSTWLQPPSPHSRLHWRPPVKPHEYYNMCHSPTSWISKTIAIGTKTGCCSSRYGRTMKFHPSLSTTPQQHALRPSSRASSPQRWKSVIVSHSSRRQIRQISMLYSVKWVSFAKGWWTKRMSGISSTREVKLQTKG